MARIANPIYDAAFKYLMDEPRVAKTLIAAVLQIEKKDILELTPDRTEISTYKKDEVNACRLDFTVRIKTKDGEKAIYIELQKIPHVPRVAIHPRIQRRHRQQSSADFVDIYPWRKSGRAYRGGYAH